MRPTPHLVNRIRVDLAFVDEQLIDFILPSVQHHLLVDRGEALERAHRCEGASHTTTLIADGSERATPKSSFGEALTYAHIVQSCAIAGGCANPHGGATKTRSTAWHNAKATLCAATVLAQQLAGRCGTRCA